MRVARTATDDGPRVVVVAGDDIIETNATDPIEFLTTAHAPEPNAKRSRLDENALLPPLQPGKIIAIGLNYRDHAEESGLAIPRNPLIFAKFPSAVVGPRSVIEKLDETSQLDYEGELGIVIGRTTRNVAPEEALQAVAGFVAANDVSARDAQFADEQWVRGKSFDTFCPIGPWIQSLDELDDPNSLDISTWVNGELRQKSNTRNLIFPVSTLVAYCSRYFTLVAGDLILSGTPGGVGFSMDPPNYLRPGDVVEVEIAGIGRLRNEVVQQPKSEDS